MQRDPHTPTPMWASSLYLFYQLAPLTSHVTRQAQPSLAGIADGIGDHVSTDRKADLFGWSVA